MVSGREGLGNCKKRNDHGHLVIMVASSRDTAIVRTILGHHSLTFVTAFAAAGLVKSGRRANRVGEKWSALRASAFAQLLVSPSMNSLYYCFLVMGRLTRLNHKRLTGLHFISKSFVDVLSFAPSRLIIMLRHASYYLL